MIWTILGYSALLWLVCFFLILIYLAFYEDEITVGSLVASLLFAPVFVSFGLFLILEELCDSETVIWRRKK